MSLRARLERYGRSRCLGQHVIGDGDKGIFLDEHLAVLHHYGQAVDIRVDNEAYIALVVFYNLRNLAEVFGYGLGVVGEVAGRIAVDFDYIVYTERAQQLWDDHSANRVDGIDGH